MSHCFTQPRHFPEFFGDLTYPHYKSVHKREIESEKMSGKGGTDQNHAQDIGFIQQHWQLVQMDYLHHRNGFKIFFNFFKN